mmetsp:Transcript_8729/g.28711  ORF Transcript_8729/g.28711 Transcript_8729/m.28711 type:complete len:303 (-) Transcript_8729:111-1019(-)
MRVGVTTHIASSSRWTTTGMHAVRAQTHIVRAIRVRSLSENDAAWDAEDERAYACRKCKDTGACACATCKGSGYLPPGGFHNKNDVNYKTAAGSRWTAHKRTRGWRHFECVGASPTKKTLTLVATCDRSVQVDVPIKMMKDRMEWSSGWKQREELDWVGDADQPGGAVARPKGGTTCVACQGVGTSACEAKGCKLGVVKLERQRAVIEKTEKMFKATLAATAGDDDIDEKTRDLRKRMKAQLKTKSKLKTEAKRNEKQAAAELKLKTKDGEDWGNYRRKTRDAFLEDWIAGDNQKNDPEKQQ